MTEVQFLTPFRRATVTHPHQVGTVVDYPQRHFHYRAGEYLFYVRVEMSTLEVSVSLRDTPYTYVGAFPARLSQLPPAVARRVRAVRKALAGVMS